LIVGAGAVGQVYAKHLQSVARVAVLVKPKYAAAARAGFDMHRLSLVRRPRAERLDNLEVLEDLAEVRKTKIDQVWICVSSSAARGEWVAELARATGNATIFALLPTNEDREYLCAHIDPARVVLGIIPFFSFEAPLGSLDVRGTAYWLPPMGPTMISGPRAAGIAAIMREAKCAHRQVRDVVGLSSFGAALIMPHLAALESCEWSFARYRRSAELVRAHDAARCAVRTVSAELGRRAPLWSHVGAWPMRLFFWGAPRMMPFDVETYTRVHFTKVREQTQLFLSGYEKRAEQHAIDPSPLRLLRAHPAIER
jgi:hypothetical protein